MSDPVNDHPTNMHNKLCINMYLWNKNYKGEGFETPVIIPPGEKRPIKTIEIHKKKSTAEEKWCHFKIGINKRDLDSIKKLEETKDDTNSSMEYNIPEHFKVESLVFRNEEGLINYEFEIKASIKHKGPITDVDPNVEHPNDPPPSGGG